MARRPTAGPVSSERPTNGFQRLLHETESPPPKIQPPLPPNIKDPPPHKNYNIAIFASIEDFWGGLSLEGRDET